MMGSPKRSVPAPRPAGRNRAAGNRGQTTAGTTTAAARATAAGGPASAAGPAAVPAEASAAGGGHRWTFLTNHSHVLIVLHAEPELVLREVARRVGITERAVQRIVQDLEAAEILTRHKVGRRNQYHVATDQPLRHPVEAHRTIGDLLRLISG